ncbi:MAG: hypothetical protein ACLGG0_15205 [Bacteriovoracia bacterium]
MARSVLVFICFINFAYAQVFGISLGEEKKLSGVEVLLQEMDKLAVDNAFDEKYRSVSLEIERQLDLKRGECVELSVRAEKEKCFREVVTFQKSYLEKSHVLKKKYLMQIHEEQINGLDEALAKALKDLERHF